MRSCRELSGADLNHSIISPLVAFYVVLPLFVGLLVLQLVLWLVG
jgi:hypothetical protein